MRFAFGGTLPLRTFCPSWLFTLCGILLLLATFPWGTLALCALCPSLPLCPWGHFAFGLLGILAKGSYWSLGYSKFNLKIMKKSFSEHLFQFHYHNSIVYILKYIKFWKNVWKIALIFKILELKVYLWIILSPWENFVCSVKSVIRERSNHCFVIRFISFNQSKSYSELHGLNLEKMAFSWGKISYYDAENVSNINWNCKMLEFPLLLLHYSS